MLIDDFDFELPEELIAKYPLANRDDSRLLYYNRESQIQHLAFKDIYSLLKPTDILVRNTTRVLPARFFVSDKEKPENKEIEILLVKELQYSELSRAKNTAATLNGAFSEKSYYWTALAKPAKRIKEEKRAFFIKADSENSGESTPAKDSPREEINIFKAKLNSDEDLTVIVEFKNYEQFTNIVTNYGSMPIPPYLQRQAEESDKDRYQTVYSVKESLGTSIAAPTAGLHFSEEIIAKLKTKGVEFIDLNLDVGIGTFKPVSVEAVKDHKMHFETYEISSENWEKILKAKASQRRIIAIGTTSLRCLESIAITGKLRGETDLYIYPGNFKFKIIDGLLTNFHLPKSTLLLLISALIGIDECKEMYRVAVENSYRFFSYGDCCLLI